MKFLKFLLLLYIVSVGSFKIKKEDLFELNKKALVNIKSRTELPFVGDTEEVILK